MADVERKGSSRAWRWRNAVARSDLSGNARSVMQALGLKMDADGGKCYPTIEDLVGLTGYSKKTVIKHLEAAEKAGWITIVKGEFWGQMHRRKSYLARFPDPASEAENIDGDEPEALPVATENSGVNMVEFLPEGGGVSTPNTVEILHHDKDSPKDSPNNSPKKSAGARAVNRAEKRRVEKAFIRWFPTWPKYSDYSTGRTRLAFERLEPHQRAACLRLTADYLRFVPARNRIANPAEYLKARAWEQLPQAPMVAPAEKVLAKPFGKLWMAYRFWLLLQPPDGRLMVTSFDQRRLDEGSISYHELMHEKRINGGWPAVNKMVADARSGEPFFCSPVLLPISSRFLQVARGADLFRAWERLHFRRGWPFFQWTTDYPWFPAADLTAGDLDAAVDAAMNEFARQVSEGLTDDAS